MRLTVERRLLQAVVALACVVPLVTGGISVLQGPGWLRGVDAVSTDLDSHFRYISGIFLALGIGFATCVAKIETAGDRFRMLGLMVVAGGLARLGSLVMVGPPSQGHIFGLGMELIVVPCLMAWQAGFAKRWARG